jgi:cobalamin biosynthesis Mg chelatase CobN
MSDKNGSSGKPDVDALREEIAQTRADLGETVQALAAKADVKARAKDQVEQTKQRVKAQAAEATQKAKEAAATASDKVRMVAAQAGDKAKGTAVQVRESGALDKAQGAKEQVRSNPVPFVAVLGGVAALVAVILIMRRRRG